MEKDFEKYKKIEISQYRITTKLEEGPHWTIYKAESKLSKNVIYAAKVITNDSYSDETATSKYFNNVKKELQHLTNSPTNSPYLFKGLSLTDFNGHRNITIFLHYKKYYNYLKMRESFTNYTKVDIKQFKISATMGKGAYGTVYKVVNKKNPNEIYAAKKIKNDCKDDERRMYQYIFGIKREIDTMINGHNPTLLEFKGLSLTDFSGENNITVFTSFAPKGSLTNICFQTKNTPVNYDNTARQIILVGISYGMMVLYKNMMIHRDFKPDNVLLDKDLHPMIGDFGFSKTINPKSSFNNSMYCGTYYYMAPELLTAFFTDDSPKYNRSVDVYAFGVSMYEVVTKNHAYENNISLLDLYNRVVVKKKRPPFNNNVKRSIQKLIDRCWAPEIEDRISFEQIFYMLAFNIDDKKSKNSYNKYYLDGVDVDRLFKYVASIIDHNIDLEVLSEKLNENVNDNINVLENNNSLSKDAVKTIKDVIRNKKKLIEKIEKIKLQPPKNIPINDGFNANSSPDFNLNANMHQEQQDQSKSMTSINTFNQNQTKPEQTSPIQNQNQTKPEQTSPIQNQNQTNPEQTSPIQNQNQTNPGSPNLQQNQNQTKLEQQSPTQNQNQTNPGSPSLQQNQNQTKSKSNPNSPLPKTDFNKNEHDINSPNEKSPRPKTQLNQQTKNQRQGQTRAKSPRGELTHNQNNLKGTKNSQLKKNTNDSTQHHPNSNQKPAKSRTPNSIMHFLNEQIKTPLNSTMHKMSQKQLDKSQSKQSMADVDDNSTKASSTSSKQSKRAATPDSNLTYMLRKKKDLKYQTRKWKQESREKTQQQPQPTKPQKTHQQEQEQEQSTKPQQLQQPQNNVHHNQDNDNDHERRRVPKVPQQKMNIINRNQPQKKRSKTPDNLIRRHNQRGQSPLNYAPQHPRPRDNFNADYDTSNFNYQNKNKANRDPRRDKNRNNQMTTFNFQHNRQNRKQGNANHARLMKRDKFKI